MSDGNNLVPKTTKSDSGLGSFEELLKLKQEQDLKDSNDPDYLRLSSNYVFNVASQFQLDVWTADEAANLLAGCVSYRPKNVIGDRHAGTNNRVYHLRRKIVNCLDTSLARAGEGILFKKSTKVYSREIVDWALSKNIDVPDEMIRAAGKALKGRREWQYSTPQLDAAFWVIDNFWEGMDVEDVPNQETVMKAIKAQFPDLSIEECRRVDRITRHPDKKSGRPRKK